MTAELEQKNSKIIPIAKNLLDWEHFGSFFGIFANFLSLYNFYFIIGSNFGVKCSQLYFILAIGIKIQREGLKMRLKGS